MLYGYTGKILHVNLNDHKLVVETPPEEFYRKYMGGSALGVYYLLGNTPPNTEPFSPENTLTLALSGLTGAPIAGQSVISAVAKSPLTGAVGNSQAEGFFPAELKFAGFDALVIHGRASEPVYLWIKNGEVELRSADNLWGKTTNEVEDLLKMELGDPKIQILQAGIAAEKGVRYAALVNSCNRTINRCGMGAVMASKNLKAIVVRGRHRPAIAHPESLSEINFWGLERFPDSNAYELRQIGTAGMIKHQHAKGGLPTCNWMSGNFNGCVSLDGQVMTDTILKEHGTCYNCFVRCKRVVEVFGEPYPVLSRFGGPEYDALAAFGSCCGVDDLKAVCYTNQLCNLYGLDTISCGSTIAWAMDCFEQGLINKHDTDGIDLRFGNAGAMIQMIEKIAHRKGFGNILADGSTLASQIIGRGTENLVVTVKCMEIPPFMPQVNRSLALVYAVNPYGPDYQASEHDSSYTEFPERAAEIGLKNPQPAEVLNEEKVRFTLLSQHFYAALGALNLCQHVYGVGGQLYGPQQLVEVVHAVMGWDVSMDELLEMGERSVNMMRMFNIREGIGPESDTLPEKLFQPLKKGHSDGMAVTQEEMDKAISEYYKIAGWDLKTGTPNHDTLERLGVAWLEKSTRES